MEKLPDLRMEFNMGDSLTPEQKRVVDFIKQFITKQSFPPTVREITDGLGYKSVNNTRQHLRLIERKGFLRIVPNKARGIEIAADDFPDDNHTEFDMGVPLVGSVAAGKPITAVENLDGYIRLDRSIFKGDGLFALRIKGESMKNIGILNGDIVVVRPKQHADNGEVVVVIIDGEATLKRYMRQNDRIFLHAENESFQDIELSSDQDIQIAGKLVGVIRKC